MDNRLIIIQNEGREAFDLAFQLFFTDKFKYPKPKTVTHYVDDPKKGLIFYEYSAPANASKLPVPLGFKQAADLAWTWLEAKDDKDYREYLDHDGSDGHGFKVYNEAWNKVDGGLLAVLPVWAWYGK